MIVDLIYVALLRCLLNDSKSGFVFLGQSLDVHRANGIERGVNEEPGVGDSPSGCTDPVDVGSNPEAHQSFTHTHQLAHLILDGYSPDFPVNEL